MRKMFLALLLGAAFGCSGGGNLPSSPSDDSVTSSSTSSVAQVAGSGAGGAEGSISLSPPTFVFTIEGAQRSDFILELWNKFESGTSRTGEPLYRQKGVGNGIHQVDASKWACLDIQADIVSPNGGLLRGKQFAAWGSCPPRPPRPRPTPTPDPKCSDFDAPVPAFSFNISEAGTVTYVSAEVSPQGGYFLPEPPKTTYSRLTEIGLYEFTYVIPYGPQELECTASAEASFEVTAALCEDRFDGSPTSGSALKQLQEHPGTPEVREYTSYWKMNQGNDNARRNACENRGGEWLDDFNIPNDGTGSTRPDVCRFVSANPPGAPGNDMTLYNPPGVTSRVVQAGTPTTFSVTVTGSYSIGEGDGGTYLIEIVYNPSNFVKKSTTVVVPCGESLTGQLVWGRGDQFNNSPNYSPNDGHVTGSYSLRITKQ